MSFVIGACMYKKLIFRFISVIILFWHTFAGICIAIKTSDGRILDLEPIDIKRLQSSKSLYDYLKDIAADENIEYILGAEYEWLSLESALKLCQKSSEIAPPPVIKQLTSNSMYPGPINVEHVLFLTLRFFDMRGIIYLFSETPIHSNKCSCCDMQKYGFWCKIEQKHTPCMGLKNFLIVSLRRKWSENSSSIKI